jgi:hypothetical protein
MPHLYLAPRGQAKTWELARYAISAALGGKKVVIFASTERHAKLIQAKVENISKSCLHNIQYSHLISEADSVSKNKIRLFDEFDLIFNDHKGEFDIRDTDGFYGTPLIQRDILHWQEDDILYQILKATEGHYQGRMWPMLYDPKVLTNALKDFPEQIELQWCGNFWTANE